MPPPPLYISIKPGSGARDLPKFTQQWLAEPSFLPPPSVFSPHLPASGSTTSPFVLLSAVGAGDRQLAKNREGKEEWGTGLGGPGPRGPDRLAGEASSACPTSGLGNSPWMGASAHNKI